MVVVWGREMAHLHIDILVYQYVNTLIEFADRLSKKKKVKEKTNYSA